MKTSQGDTVRNRYSLPTTRVRGQKELLNTVIVLIEDENVAMRVEAQSIG